jgi:hypothetical protein
MSELTIVYRGVPLGIAVTTPRDEGPRNGPAALPPRPLQIYCEEFYAVAAYETVAQTIQLATRAYSNFGFIGPAADPASALAGTAAQAEARQLCDELEIHDSEGRATNGRVIWFLDGYSPFGTLINSRYLLHIELSESGAAIPALLRHPLRDDVAYEVPPQGESDAGG